MKIVTFRNKKEVDLIGIFIEQKDEYIVIEHPFFIQYNPISGNVAMAPFCVFSDQSQFRFSLRELQFVVPVRKPIAKHFIKMVQAVTEQEPFDEESQPTTQDTSDDLPEDPHFGVQLVSKNIH